MEASLELVLVCEGAPQIVLRSTWLIRREVHVVREPCGFFARLGPFGFLGLERQSRFNLVFAFESRFNLVFAFESRSKLVFGPSGQRPLEEKCM